MGVTASALLLYLSELSFIRGNEKWNVMLVITFSCDILYICLYVSITLHNTPRLHSTIKKKNLYSILSIHMRAKENSTTSKI